MESNSAEGNMESELDSSESKPNSRREGLEEIVKTLRKEANELGVDEGEYISHNLAKHSIRYLATSKNEEAEGKDSPHGSFIVPYFHNKRTGETEYLVEQPKSGSEAGKIKFIGGHKKIGESHKQAARRESSEEVSYPGKKIIQEGELEYYITMHDIVDGQPTSTVIYKLEIESGAKWEMIKASHGTHDAGNFRIVNSSTLLGLKDSYIAYGENWANMVKGFVQETSGRSYGGPLHYAPKVSLESKIAFTPMV